MTVNVYCLTSMNYLWALKPFAYLFNLFWSEQQPCIIVSDVVPDFELPPNFQISTINENDPLPQSKWSNGVIRMLNNIQDDVFVLMLEDYWLTRKVDNTGVDTLADYQRIHDDILRVDLTDDRQFAGDKYEIEAWGHYDLVETPSDSPYQMSLQAGIWNRRLLRKLMRPELNPWQVELFLSPTLHERKDMRAIGTKQCPVRYINAFKGGDSSEVLNLDGIPEQHRQHMEEQGWLKN